MATQRVRLEGRGVMLKARKALLTVLVVGLAGILVGFGTFSAFSSTTSNSGNNFSAGTVFIDDNDGGASVMYNVTNKKPLDSVQSCIKVTYSGSLDATVKLYASAIPAGVGDYITLNIIPGTGANAFGPACTGFSATGADLNGGATLKAFADAHSGWNNGLAVNPPSVTKWVATDAVVYKFVLTLQDNNAANGGATALSTGNHSFTWEAQNQ
jgi:predicted ribosomally synthesized peptide with SipW-like signal peptide